MTNIKKKENPLPCPHGRYPLNGQDGWKHCPHCLGVNQATPTIQKNNLIEKKLEEIIELTIDAMKIFTDEQPKVFLNRTILRTALKDSFQAGKEEGREMLLKELALKQGYGYHDSKDFDEGFKKGKEEAKKEVLEKIKKKAEQYHGGGNGRRLFIQLEGEIK